MPLSKIFSWLFPRSEPVATPASEDTTAHPKDQPVADHEQPVEAVHPQPGDTPGTADSATTVPAEGSVDAEAGPVPAAETNLEENPPPATDKTPAEADQTDPTAAPVEPTPGPETPENETDPREPEAREETAPARPRRVYMIRCQDDKLNRPLEECLSQWGFAITPIPGDYSEAALDELLRRDPQIGFAVVPLSRDEFHYAKDAKPATALLQSSPDVIFKLGFLCGRLGKTNCFVLYQEQKSYTLPTALINVLFTVMDPHRHWQDVLRDRLRHAGLAPVEGSA